MAGEIVENFSTGSARDLLEAARSASFDYASCELQIIALRTRAESLGGGTSAGSVGGGHSGDVLERRVSALVDRERDLEGRMARDEAVMDAACELLYGEDGRGGLSALVPTFWVDGLWWHYLQGETWSKVGRTLGYSPDRIKACARQAIEVADGYGMTTAAEGVGIAEDDTARHDVARRDPDEHGGCVV